MWAVMLVKSPHADASRTTNDAWIGYHDMHAEGCSAGSAAGGQCDEECVDYGFIWTDGSPSDFDYWSSGEPNDWNGSAADCSGNSADGGFEDCTEIRNNRGGRWNDRDCTDNSWYWCGACSANAQNPASYEFVAEGATADVAEFMCTTKGGHLASLHSQADQDLVNGMVDVSVWIGYHDQHVEGCSRNDVCGHDCPVLETGFIWSDGTANDYANWADGEPNDWNTSGVSDCSQASETGIEDCTEMWRGGDDWNDADCAANRKYVCGFSYSGPNVWTASIDASTAQCNDTPCSASSTPPVDTNHVGHFGGGFVDYQVLPRR
jgi:hypothetical protein